MHRASQLHPSQGPALCSVCLALSCQLRVGFMAGLEVLDSGDPESKTAVLSQPQEEYR